MEGLTDDNREKLIAVLPFESNLIDPKDSILLAGLADEIINGFSKLQGLKPISFFSSRGYDPKKFTPQEFGRKLGVDFLLLGKTLEIEGESVLRIQLLELENDKILWGETFDLAGENLIAFQKLVSQRVLASIIPNFERSAEARNLRDRIPASDLANRHFLKGKGHYQIFSESHNDSAIVEFKKALALDSSFALAYAGLGDAFSQEFREHKGGPVYLDSCLWSGEKAVNLNPRLAEGYKTIANYYNYKGQLVAGNHWLRKALEIDKDFAPALGNLGSNYMSMGKLDSAKYYQTKAAALNPGLYLPFQISGWINRLLMDYGTALAFLNKSLQINRDFKHDIPGMTYEQLALTYLGLNQPDSARICVQKTLKLLEDYRDMDGKFDVTKYATISKTYESAGIIAFFIKDFKSAKKYFEQSIFFNPYKNQDPWSYSPVYLSYLESQINPAVGKIFLDDAIALYLSEIESGTEDGEFYFNIACLYATQGDHQKCLEMIEGACQRGWRDIQLVQMNPMFDRIRTNNKFKSLINQINRQVLLMGES
jgi:TolB-like protein/Tfp pilus assembly protein PilF